MKVLLFNLGEVDFKVEVGERVAQLIVERVSCVFFFSVLFPPPLSFLLGCYTGAFRRRDLAVPFESLGKAVCSAVDFDF